MQREPTLSEIQGLFQSGEIQKKKPEDWRLYREVASRSLDPGQGSTVNQAAAQVIEELDSLLAQAQFIIREARRAATDEKHRSDGSRASWAQHTESIDVQKKAIKIAWISMGVGVLSFLAALIAIWIAWMAWKSP